MDRIYSTTKRSGLSAKTRRKPQTIDAIKGVSASDKTFSYQMKLTRKLDKFRGNFNQGHLNEILLWKVNRYPTVDIETLQLINKIKIGRALNESLTRDILNRLLNKKFCRGIRLPVASTILRFKNPHVYQIIDQRAYRAIYGTDLTIPRETNSAIDLYLKYLKALSKKAKQYDFPFSQADRILYKFDKRINKGFGLKNY